MRLFGSIGHGSCLHRNCNDAVCTEAPTWYQRVAVFRATGNELGAGFQGGMLDRAVRTLLLVCEWLSFVEAADGGPVVDPDPQNLRNSGSVRFDAGTRAQLRLPAVGLLPMALLPPSELTAAIPSLASQEWLSPAGGLSDRFGVLTLRRSINAARSAGRRNEATACRGSTGARLSGEGV